MTATRPFLTSIIPSRARTDYITRMTASVIPPSPSREEYARDYAAALAANGDETIFDRTEPIGLFVEWLADARAHEQNDPNAMTLSTIDADSEAIEARVRAEEEAEAKAQQQAAPQDGTSPPQP